MVCLGPKSLVLEVLETRICLEGTSENNEQNVSLLATVEPRFNEVQRDWGNWFVEYRGSLPYILKGRAEEYRSLYRGFCYTEDF